MISIPQLKPHSIILFHNRNLNYAHSDQIKGTMIILSNERRLFYVTDKSRFCINSIDSKKKVYRRSEKQN